MNGLFRSVLIVSSLALAGCVSTGTEDVNPDNYADFNLGSSPLKKDYQAKAPQQDEVEDSSTKGSATTEVSRIQQLPSITQQKIGTLNEQPVFADPDKLISVSVDELTVSEFIHHIYGDLLDLDYAIDPKVEEMRTKVVLRLQTPVAQPELYKLSASLLEQNKVMVATKDNILYFQPYNPKDQQSKPVGIGSSVADIPNVSGTIVQLIPYTFNSSQTIQRIVTKLTNATLYPYDDQKLIVAEGNYAELVKVVELVNSLDVPSAKGRDIRYLSFVYSSASDMIDLLTEILTTEGLRVSSAGGDIAFISVPAQNSVIAYSTSATLGERVVSWAKKLDKPEEGEKSRFYIYRPTYSKAEDLYESLQGFVTGSSSSSSSSQSKASVSATGQNANTAGKAVTAASEANSNSIIQTGQFKISVDKIQNSLLVQATPMQYRELLELVEQLDKLPPQIALDVAIAEFDISDNYTAGIAKILYDSTASDGYSKTLTVTPTSGSLSFSGVFDSTTIDFDLIAQKTKSKILSRPYLVVQDGQSASISAGKQIPVQTGSSTTDGGTTTTTIQYTSTGVSLTVTPTINADGVVALELSQSVSSSDAGAGDLNPTITDRSLSTAVLVGNGQTAILGGLIQNNESKNGNSVPFFSSIPLLGNLFKSKSDTFSRSELVIMITPQIISDKQELDDFTGSMKELFTLPIGQDLK